MQMLTIARDYFEQLFTGKGMGIEVEYLLSEVKECINVDVNSLITSKYTEDEVVSALNSMGPTKAPGSDDFLSLIF